MQWFEVTIKTNSGGIDLLCERLTVLGYDSFLIDDEEDFRRFLEQNRQYWDYVDESLAAQMKGMSQVRLYFEAADEVDTLLRQLEALREKYGDALAPLRAETRRVRDEDWENSWKQYYTPVAVGERFLVVPKWLHPEIPDGRVPVILDPGMIFGTGMHASTQMCMRALERQLRGGDRVLDLGSGSGILSIAALRLGAKSAVGVDIDPMAEDIARENAALNELGADRFTALTGDVIGDGELVKKLGGDYDVVLANIVADVIIPLSKVVPSLLAKNGRFICSGILDIRLDEVKLAIEQNGMEIESVAEQEDWRQISAKHKGA
ncbi:MAG: 50S ribosomal protein L11 methyltransferase [Oscillospiraceae bacterium]|nr:50S ribosomal protein L11 methyltransferase [Oscillospiraceae bacterium]